MNTSFVPTPQDEQLRLEATGTTKTATFVGTTFNFSTNFPAFFTFASTPGVRLAAVLKIASLVGTGTYSAKVQESADGATWTDASPAVTVAAAGALSIPFFLSQPYVRVSITIGGTSPSIVYEGWLNSNI